MPSKVRPAARGLSAPELALADKPPMFIRRSSREQGGLGRDLEGEVVRAMEDGPEGPSLALDETLEEKPDEEVSASDSARIHIRA